MTTFRSDSEESRMAIYTEFVTQSFVAEEMTAMKGRAF